MASKSCSSQLSNLLGTWEFAELALPRTSRMCLRRISTSRFKRTSTDFATALGALLRSFTTTSVLRMATNSSPRKNRS